MFLDFYLPIFTTLQSASVTRPYNLIIIIIYLKEFMASNWLTAMCEIVMSNH